MMAVPAEVVGDGANPGKWLRVSIGILSFVIFSLASWFTDAEWLLSGDTAGMG